MLRTKGRGVAVLVGTKKGAFIFRSADRRKWKALGPFFEGKEVNHLAFDPRDGKTIYAAVTSPFWGHSVQRTTDLGRNWTKQQEGPKFPEGSKLKVERLWHVEPGPTDEPDTVYLGVDPGALFVSNDEGDSWKVVDSLTNHSTREKWAPGAGGMCLHSILINPKNPKIMHVGISAAGVFRTEDGGYTWRPYNERTRADFLPDKYPEVGQCVHKVVEHPNKPGFLYQQNHCGVYSRSPDASQWSDLGKGLPSTFGFPMAIHAHDPETIYVIPEVSGFFHVVPNGRLAVYRSNNSGKTWRRLSRGLPQRGAFVGVHREGMAVDQYDPCGVYFGTNTGQLFHSANEGESWKPIAEYLPSILSVGVATL